MYGREFLSFSLWLPRAPQISRVRPGKDAKRESNPHCPEGILPEGQLALDDWRLDQRMLYRRQANHRPLLDCATPSSITAPPLLQQARSAAAGLPPVPTPS